ncbi:MAG: MFS transporter [Bacteroidetes bacterium]|nr:MFS transporter [Bacteroidota bacterium]
MEANPQHLSTEPSLPGGSVESRSIYNSAFWTLCLSSLFFFASFNMIIPELPSYLSSLGGADYKGLIISLFTLTALISRPFSGTLADRIGRKPIIMAGSMVCFICSLLYPLLSTVYGFFLLRLLHGFSTGFTPTGQAAYLSDVIPADRRGEAMGLLGTAGTLGMAGGPALGGWLSSSFSVQAMFYVSSGLAICSSLMVVTIRETMHDKHPVSMKLLKIQKSDFLEPRVLAPCVVMALGAYAYGTLFTIIPDFGVHVGIQNKGLLFTYFTVASLLIRLIAGRTSDTYGRVTVLKFSTLLMTVSMLWISYADTQLLLIIGVFLYGLAQGATSPTLLAWATDLSDPLRKGRGVASLYIFMEFGIGMGALLSGIIFGNQSERIYLTFLISGGLSAIAFLYLMVRRTSVAI